MALNKIYSLVPAVAAAALLAGCDQLFDSDLRSGLGQGFDTSDAARRGAAARPKPDSRGVITYPNYQVVVARQNDTPTSIASRLGINASQLASYNGLTPDTALRGGEVLSLPVNVGGSTNAAQPVQTDEISSRSLDPITPAAGASSEPSRHKVARGETAYSIARRYGVPLSDLAALNGLGADFAVREDQILLIPVVSGRSNQTASISQPGQGSSTPVPPSAAQPLPEASNALPAATASASTSNEPDISLPGGSSGGSGNFIMPVDGSIIRDYEKGKNDGLDISANAGAPVRAASGGRVVAVTEDTGGKNIVVVRHQGSLLSIYANLASVNVSKDQSVSQGDRLGALGNEASPYLHFEIRDGFESKDPTAYLR